MHEGRAYLMTGPESLSRRDLVAILAAAVGRPVHVKLSPQQWRTEVGGALPAYVADGLLNIWAAADRVPQPTDRTLREITGQEARTFAACSGGQR